MILSFSTPSSNLKTEDLIHHAKLACLMPTLYQGVHSRLVVEQYAALHGLSVCPRELQVAADNIRRSHQLTTAHQTWAWLERHHLSLDEFEEMVQSSLLSAKVADHLFAHQVESFFCEHQASYRQVILYEILLEDYDVAMELHYAFQDGDLDFHQAAHRFIRDEEMRRRGGYRGPLRRSDLIPDLSAPAFAATPPQILAPIVSREGYHLLLVESFIEPHLTDELRSEILAALFGEWLETQIYANTLTQL